MAAKGIVFDQDCRQLTKLLLRKYAVDNADYWEYGGRIEKQIAFEVANRALVAMGCITVEKKPPPPEPKK
jgi:hypothetical protein